MDESSGPAAASATTTPTPQQVVLRFYDEVVCGRDLSVLDEICAPDVHWSGGALGEHRGLDNYRRVLATIVEGTSPFSQMKVQVKDSVASGTKVALRFSVEAIHSAAFAGASASGSRLKWDNVGIYTVIDGLITDMWVSEDMLAVLLQLNAVPPLWG